MWTYISWARKRFFWGSDPLAGQGAGRMLPARRRPAADGAVAGARPGACRVLARALTSPRA